LTISVTTNIYIKHR